ncbi:MAG: hypothetical protein EVJ46_04170 [Candidatus Acididesulfobacter guangdongensis]|uniref:Uncharacterized protein n=1 Tax=Acididesulfobacter guangdongensis TaxID=2597225 RepID=A0A519BJJ4_ACIG2|nr:MAG: hypothetical protein EVJ46_04170 [Candidatus Acididesulfobacter guangdongensis]
MNKLNNNIKKSNKIGKRDKPKNHSFILDMPLIATVLDEHILNIRFESARKLYNAVLEDALNV